MKFIKWFKEIDKRDVALAGGKGANLGELVKIGMPLPDGFVILASAFERFLAEAGINNNSKIIRHLIINGKIPKGLEKEIQDAYRLLKAKYVAVRSSATAEDSKIDSWAGALESYLNTGKDDLIKNVKKCWASLYSPRALFYRAKRGLKAKLVSVAVVVQKMVQSEVSGVCFTAHPITKSKNQMVIEAVLGLGESLVQGLVTPDMYVLDKRKIDILDININPQNKKIGGKVPKIKQEKQKLSLTKIKELSKLCVRIENHYQVPQDIEWALAGGKIYILQTRPITTL